MKLGVIIVTKNEEKTLPYLLGSIREQTFKNLKIIVADANSTDKTREIAKKNDCWIVNGGNPSQGRNNGAKKAIENNLDYLIFIDADVILPSKYFLEKALGEFIEKRLDVAGTLQIPLDIHHKINIKNIIKTAKKSKDFRYNALYGITNFLLKLLQNTRNPCMQNCMLAKAKVHQKIGGFKLIVFGEDSEYSKNAVKKGYKFAILKTPGKVFTSTRRLESKGFFKMLIIYIYFNTKRVIFNHEIFNNKTKRRYFDL